MSKSLDFQNGHDAYHKSDYATALREVKPLAELGHARAAYVLSLMYKYGQGVPEDNKISVKWCKRAAVNGNVEAQFAMGVSYKFGQCVPQDDKAAFKWFALGADQEDSNSQYALGCMSWSRNIGQGVKVYSAR